MGTADQGIGFMSGTNAPVVRDAVPDWIFAAVIGLVFGLPMCFLVGAALIRNPVLVAPLIALFILASWWFFKGRANRSLPPPPDNDKTPVRAPQLPSLPVPRDLAWVPWDSVEPPTNRSIPIKFESLRATDSILDGLHAVVPPIETDLRFTRRFLAGNRDVWMDVDRSPDGSLVVIQKQGRTAPNVSAAARVELVVTGTGIGSAGTGWLRVWGAGRWTALPPVAFGAVLGALSLGYGITNAAEGQLGGLLFGLALAAGFVAFAAIAVPRQRKLARGIASDVLGIVQGAIGTRLLAPAAGQPLPGAPPRIVCTTERAVQRATYQVRIANPFSNRQWLRALGVLGAGTLLVFGSALALL